MKKNSIKKASLILSISCMLFITGCTTNANKPNDNKASTQLDNIEKKIVNEEAENTKKSNENDVSDKSAKTEVSKMLHQLQIKKFPSTHLMMSA